MAETSRTGPPLLHLQELTKRFGDIEAVRGIDLQIGEGSFVAIMGPSGCGKTTTLRMLAGLERPTAGRIFHRGRDITSDMPWERDMPMVWQNLALFPFLDVMGNVAFGPKMAGLARGERRRRAQDWLDRLGIGHLRDRDISRLSGGQLQRVALARALVNEPDILLLDEPLSALDAHLIVRMQAELGQLQRELGITFVYVTHSQSEAFAMADRVVIMNDGLIQQIGAPKEVYRWPRNRFVAEFVGTNNILEGEVVGIEGDVVAVATPLGTFRGRNNPWEAVRAGQRAILVVAADVVELAAEGTGSQDNRLEARVLSEEFIGTVVTLYLETGGKDFRVQLQQRALDRLDLPGGEGLVVAWDAQQAMVIGEDS